MTAPGFTREELEQEQRKNGTALARSDHRYDGMVMAVSPLEAKHRLEQLQAFVASTMVKDLDYGTIPGTDKPCLYQPGSQKLAEIYGFAHRFHPVESVKDWERGFFYFEYRCELTSRRDGAFICEGIGSCNSRESKYAGRWVFGSDVPAGVDKSKCKMRGGISKKGKAYTLYLVPNEDPYSLINTIQKMAAKRAYVHAVISATRSAGIFTQDVEDLPREAFGEPAHDAETGEVKEAPAQAPDYLRQIATADAIPMLNAIWKGVLADERAGVIPLGSQQTLGRLLKARKAELSRKPETGTRPSPDMPQDPDPYPDGNPDEGS